MFNTFVNYDTMKQKNQRDIEGLNTVKISRRSQLIINWHRQTLIIRFEKYI